MIDGEIIVANEKSISNFGKLQNWRSESRWRKIFYMFDILWLDGYNLTEITMMNRKEILNKISPSIENIRLSESFDSGATEFFEVAKKMHLEGIIAKKTIANIFPANVREIGWK